jgi:hypothetical protein
LERSSYENYEVKDLKSNEILLSSRFFQGSDVIPRKAIHKLYLLRVCPNGE